jgi:hypothetical protein
MRKRRASKSGGQAGGVKGLPERTGSRPTCAITLEWGLLSLDRVGGPYGMAPYRSTTFLCNIESLGVPHDPRPYLHEAHVGRPRLPIYRNLRRPLDPVLTHHSAIHASASGGSRRGLAMAPMVVGRVKRRDPRVHPRTYLYLDLVGDVQHHQYTPAPTADSTIDMRICRLKL